MSTRTIIEINHDCLTGDVLETLSQLVAAMPSTGPGGLRALARDSNGVRVLGQRHHADHAALSINGHVIWQD